MLEIDGDDSSDAEDTDIRLQEYTLEDKFAEFKNRRSPTFYVRKHDPEGYSFLAYSMGVQLLYSPGVNSAYKEKKKTLGHTTLNTTQAKIQEWLLKTIEQTVHNILLIAREPTVSKQLATNFLAQEKDFVDQDILAWSKTNLRTAFKQINYPESLPEVDDCLITLKAELKSYVKNQDIPAAEFTPPPFFNLDDFINPIKKYIKTFYSKTKLLQAAGNFATIRAKEWKTVIGENPLEVLMVQEAKNYNGRQTIEDVTVGTVRKVFEALVEKDLAQNEHTIIEKIGGQYRLKLDTTDTDIEDSPICFLFGEEAQEKYLPYDNEKMIEQLLYDIDLFLEEIFVEELRKFQKQMGITLERGVLSQQPTFSSANTTEHLANIRLNLRDKRRRIRQARDDEERVTITGEAFNAAWQMPTQTCLALEKQEITSGGARTDIVTNLENYKGIHTELERFKVDINHEMKKKPKISDKLIAGWIRDILTTGTPTATRSQTKNSHTETTHFEDIPPRFQKTFLRFLVNLTYLLFGCEAQRNPGSLIIHQMMLDLIESKDLTWTRAIAKSEFEINCGGGDMPMSMGTYSKGQNEKGKDKKGKSEPVQCARALHSHYGLFAVKSWRYDGASASESPKNQDSKHIAELLRRENALAKRWFELKKLDNKPTTEQIQGIQAAIPKWYPAPK